MQPGGSRRGRWTATNLETGRDVSITKVWLEPSDGVRLEVLTHGPAEAEVWVAAEKPPFDWGAGGPSRQTPRIPVKGEFSTGKVVGVAPERVRLASAA